MDIQMSTPDYVELQPFTVLTAKSILHTFHPDDNQHEN